MKCKRDTKLKAREFQRIVMEEQRFYQNVKSEIVKNWDLSKSKNQGIRTPLRKNTLLGDNLYLEYKIQMLKTTDLTTTTTKN